MGNIRPSLVVLFIYYFEETIWWVGVLTSLNRHDLGMLRIHKHAYGVVSFHCVGGEFIEVSVEFNTFCDVNWHLDNF